jgi:hypothetical protein
MRREGLNRQLSLWRDEGLIAIEDGRISVRNFDKLEQAADQAG